MQPDVSGECETSEDGTHGAVVVGLTLLHDLACRLNGDINSNINCYYTKLIIIRFECIRIMQVLYGTKKRDHAFGYTPPKVNRF